MPDLDDFHAFQSTGGGSDDNTGSNGGGSGCGWFIVIAIFVVVFSIAIGIVNLEAIGFILGLVFLVFLVVNSFFKNDK